MLELCRKSTLESWWQQIGALVVNCLENLTVKMQAAVDEASIEDASRLIHSMRWISSGTGIKWRCQ